MNHYSEPHRAYHTMTHIRECLMQFDNVAEIAEHPDQLEAAIWFHDAVYDPKSDQNEEKSAESAYLSLTKCGVSSAIARKITNLILATRHDTTRMDNDEKLIADIDLCILGSQPQKFDEYETQIRREYHFVPDEDYQKGRSEILRYFIEREMIYQTDIFRVQYQTQARENIHCLLHRLNNQN
ncbi:MAG: N-methyl-D-aspartate receptor NMDAR2C subunit [Desulfobacteraceae bacterium]|nr:N-methyl-D-aspartate receptor NMDAR2C subunit [Desulfobacteraceae bacterium]